GTEPGEVQAQLRDSLTQPQRPLRRPRAITAERMSKHLVRGLLVAAAVAIAVPTALAASDGTSGGGRAAPAPRPASVAPVPVGPDGGTVWLGRIPNRVVADRRLSAVYLPPGASASNRYPVIYLLHGMSGGPTSYVYGMRLAKTSDDLISSHVIRPFIA